MSEVSKMTNVWGDHHWDEVDALKAPWVVCTAQDTYEKFESDYIVFLTGPTNDPNVWRRTLLDLIASKCQWSLLKKRVVFIIPETRAGWWNEMNAQKSRVNNPQLFAQLKRWRGRLEATIQIGWEQQYLQRIRNNPSTGCIVSWGDVDFKVNIGPTYRFECGELYDCPSYIHGQPDQAVKMSWLECALVSDQIQGMLVDLSKGSSPEALFQEMDHSFAHSLEELANRVVSHIMKSN
jgi:hypothetical protein